MADSLESGLEYFCSSCKDYNKTEEATFCCNKCMIYLCESCVCHHEKLFRRHEELGIKDRDQWFKTEAPTKKQACEVHKDKTLEYYCDDHARHCCITCILLEHRSCTKLCLCEEKEPQKEPIQTMTMTKTTDTRDHVYSTKSHSVFNVKTVSNTGNCSVYGSCLLPNGNLVVADFGDKTLKLFNTNQTPVGTLCIQKNVWSVCRTTGNEIAVAVAIDDGKDEVQFARVEDRSFSFVKKFKTDHRCYCIIYRADKLYIGSDTTIYLYSMTGQVLKKLFVDSSGVKGQWRLTVSKDDQRFHMIEYSRGIMVTTDLDGLELSRITDSDIKYPHGICVAENGNIFICAKQIVVQLNQKGEKLPSVAWDIHGIGDTRSICYRKSTSELLVGQAENKITVLKLE